MSLEAAKHYAEKNLLQLIEEGVKKLGRTPQTISVEDLASVDEFHIGGREATRALMEQLGLSEDKQLLDVGCGLGGSARYVVSQYNCQVTGIDLTADYVKTGNELCKWVGLDKQIKLLEGNALALPFGSESFDSGYMIHVGMNIDDKVSLFKEIKRVLRTGAIFGIYDIMKANGKALIYPVPWAASPGTSYLASSSEYKNILEHVGFRVLTERNRTEFAKGFYERMKAKLAGGLPSLGLHLLMGESTQRKLQHMVSGIHNGAIAPVEIIVVK